MRRRHASINDLLIQGIGSSVLLTHRPPADDHAEALLARFTAAIPRNSSISLSGEGPQPSSPETSPTSSAWPISGSPSNLPGVLPDPSIKGLFSLRSWRLREHIPAAHDREHRGEGDCRRRLSNPYLSRPRSFRIRSRSGFGERTTEARLAPRPLHLTRNSFSPTSAAGTNDWAY